jgi:cytochrome c oxidase assembly protein subunit 15
MHNNDFTMEKNVTFYIKFTTLTLALLFLLIAAGSIVRSTGSGMGCPDWPKCFGYLVPPTDISTLTYTNGRAFEKGQMVIAYDTLWVATKDIVAEVSFDRTVWIKYPKHDYSTFNAKHTWIEYLNRLLGALTGLFVLGMFLLSVKSKNRKLIIVSLLVLVFTLFQAWLGAKVVASNLAPIKITTHMAMAFVILLMIVYILFSLKNKSLLPISLKDNNLKKMAIALFIFTFLQMIVGTQVRQEIDRFSHELVNEPRQTWIDGLGYLFMGHKNMALILTLATFWLLKKMKMAGVNVTFPFNALFAITIVEFGVGLCLNFLGLPWFLQPIHLVLAGMILSIQFYLMLHFLSKEQ